MPFISRLGLSIAYAEISGLSQKVVLRLQPAAADQHDSSRRLRRPVIACLSLRLEARSRPYE